MVVTGNGMVVRVRDGHLLGTVDGKQHTYFNMTGAGDVFYMTQHIKEHEKQKHGSRKMAAVRLGIDGDKLTQERLWVSKDATGNWEKSSSLSLVGDRLYFRAAGKAKNGHASGMTILDIKTGDVVKTRGPVVNFMPLATGIISAG